MLYGLATAGPQWIELVPAQGDRPAGEVLFPIDPSPKALRKAREAMAKARADGMAAGHDQRDILFDAGDAFSRELIRWSILDWRGFGDEATDTPLPPTQDVVVRDEAGEIVSTTPGTITAFLGRPRLFEAADEKWVIPWTRRDAEGNGFAPLSDGTSDKATQAGDIASKPATRRVKAGATSARTSSTKRRRTKVKPSGS